MADALGDSGFKLSSIFPESLVSRLHQCEMLSDSSQQNPIPQAFIRSSDFLQFPVEQWKAWSHKSIQSFRFLLCNTSLYGDTCLNPQKGDLCPFSLKRFPTWTSSELFSKASFCTNPSSVLLRIQPFCCSTPAYEPKLWSLGFIHAHFEISTWYGGNHKKLQKGMPISFLWNGFLIFWNFFLILLPLLWKLYFFGVVFLLILQNPIYCSLPAELISYIHLGWQVGRLVITHIRRRAFLQFPIWTTTA